MTDAEPPAIAPDTKDWTWVIEQGCPECGFRPPPAQEVAARLRASVPRWQAALRRPDATTRPQPGRWSALEYGCHVRDVCLVFGERLGRMLAEDDPAFANWDQDEAAVAGRYHAQFPEAVAAELADAAERIAAQWSAVRGPQWQRRGTRSNGSQFTVATLAVYFLHDVEHHLVDVAGPAQ